MARRAMSRGGEGVARVGRLLFWGAVGGAAAAAACHVGLLLFIFFSRIGYPLDLEWMESGMLCHALRVAQGAPLYAEPSVDFVSFLYTPLYPWLVGTTGRLLGVSYLLGRAISVASFLGAMAIAFRVVQREVVDTRLAAVLWGLITAGLIAASFPHTGAWYDLVRSDSLYLLLTSGGLYLLRYHHRSWWCVLAAGVLLGMAFLTKQTASLFIIFAGAALLLINWRRLLLLVPVVGIVAGGTTLALNHVSGGWFWRYVFEMHQGHDLYWDRIWPKTELKLLSLSPVVGGLLGLWLLVWLGGMVFRRRRPSARERRLLYWFALALVGVAVSAVGFATQWAVENAYIPGLYFSAVFAGVAGADLLRRAGIRRRLWSGALALALCGALGGQLLLQIYSPYGHIPDRAMRSAASSLLRRMRQLEPPLLVPYHPFYPQLLGQPTSYHQMSVNDVTRAGYPLPRGIRERLRRKHYGAVIFDNSPEGRYDFAFAWYKFEHYFEPGETPPVITGYKQARPRYLLLPKRRALPPPPGVRRVFDFEDGSYRGFAVRGRAFGSAPAGRGAEQRLAGPYEGVYLASSAVRGVRATGALVSPEFVVDRPLLRYRAGGGNERGIRVRLLVAGKVVHSGSGTASHIMRQREVDVAAYLGRKMRLELVDHSTRNYLLFDELTLSGR